MGKAGDAAASPRKAGRARGTSSQGFRQSRLDVFSNQKWDRLKESYAEDIVVTWPDGHETKGVAKHIEDLKALFVSLPTSKSKNILFGLVRGHGQL
jgi:hypothetical protein